ncbi:MAG: acyl carrier protein [Eggerthellaceae bacterium]
MDTMQEITELLHDNLDIDTDKVTKDATFDSLGIDSLDMVELTCDLEDKCGIEFGEPEGLKTVGDLVEYVDKLKAEQGK